MYAADFHIHSRYSRATSKEMNLDGISQWARYKGIDLVGTGDFTHFLWFHELKNKLQPTDRTGIYRFGGIDFILSTEVCAIFDRQGKSKRIHLLLFVSRLERAEKLNYVLEKYGDVNIDGRPMLHLEARDLVEVLKGADEDGFIVPAHIWTPHFSLFGSNSGFDRIEECFDRYAGEIVALETGLSSDPEMNWRVSALDRYALISNSDAHSPSKLGRELNVFDGPFDFPELRRILREKDAGRFRFTMEYFPEEGKYHYDGHRSCGVSLAPEESLRQDNICPVCGRRVTVGVMHRVLELADRPPGGKPEHTIGFKKMVPLDQIIGAVFGRPADSPVVEAKYLDIVRRLGSELTVLLTLDEEELRKNLEPELAEGIRRVRAGAIQVSPGYDGEFGKIEIFPVPADAANEQTLF